MNTQKRRQAMARSSSGIFSGQGLQPQEASARSMQGALYSLLAARHASPESPICVPGPNRACTHALVDRDLNTLLHRYEQTVRGRFESIEEVLRTLSAQQHDRDFPQKAQALARQQLDMELPAAALENAWVDGVDMAALYAHAMFQTISRCVQLSDQDQAPWRNLLPVQPHTLRSCGYHTLDITPCADGRLQGVLPFVLRTAPSDDIFVKAYAGVLFDIETDVADWSHRELERCARGEQVRLDYLKVAVYHFSSSSPCHQGCAAHDSKDDVAIAAAIDRLDGLRAAIDNLYGLGSAPQVMLIGMDTDLDAIRVHLPDSRGRLHADRYLDGASLYCDTLGLGADRALATIQREVEAYVHDLGGIAAKDNAQGMMDLATQWLVANLSQIEYVIAHHDGRYDVIGHDEFFVCAGEMMEELHLRNQFYFAHLDTVEEGVADLDVGVKIFTGLNIKRGLPMPVLVHFEYSSRVPGGRERAVARSERVAAAICARYPELSARGLLKCQVAISDRMGSERLQFIADTAAAVDAH